MRVGNSEFEDACFSSIVCSETSNGFRSKPSKHSDFGKEVQRSFAVHAYCYDCKKFIDGCKGWSARRDFACVKIKLYPRVEAGVK